MERQFIIPEHILLGLIRYMETRPYKEVAQGIDALSRLEELKPAPDDPLDQSTE